MENEEKSTNEVIEEKGEVIYQLTQDEYKSLVHGLETYKEKYEEALKMLQEEKENVVELLLRVEALEDQVKGL